MEEKEKIPYAQGKLLNDAVRKNYSIIISNTRCILPFCSYLVLL